jgi:plastocyanin
MRSAVTLFLSVTVVLTAACGGSGGAITNPGNNASGGTTSGTTAANAVGVTDDQFTPANISVAVGTKVTWTWAGTRSQHNVTFADGTASATLGPDATFSRTFNSAGTFTYRCTIHSGMTGSVVVQ